jgi:hypothetical protein
VFQLIEAPEPVFDHAANILMRHISVYLHDLGMSGDGCVCMDVCIDEWQGGRSESLKEMDTLRVHRRHPERKLTQEEQDRQNARLLYASAVKVCCAPAQESYDQGKHFCDGDIIILCCSLARLYARQSCVTTYIAPQIPALCESCLAHPQRRASGLRC